MRKLASVQKVLEVTPFLTPTNDEPDILGDFVLTH